MSPAPFSDATGLYDHEGFDGSGGFGNGFVGQLGASTSTSSVVLVDGGSTEELAASTDVTRRKGGGGAREEKAEVALRSHSEAERRRRERINAHLATLRSMVPCTDKMDKAALLAEVIDRVKKLKTDAERVGRHCPVPSGADELTVEEMLQEAAYSSRHGSICGDGEGDSDSSGGGGVRSVVKATISCDDCADLFADVQRALRPLRPRLVGSEIATLGGRVRLTFVMSREGDVTAASVHQALKPVLDRASPAAVDFAPRAAAPLLSKRRRVSSVVESSSSSS